jgi:protein arginine kinase activator
MDMLCQQCKQANATVHLTDILPNGEPAERHLCEVCANEEGITMKPHDTTNLMLDKFVKMGAGIREAAQRTCPECGISFGEFRSQGLLGCPNDYQVFGDLLMPLIERAHNGASQHVGKVPGQPDPAGRRRAMVAQMRRRLDAAVADEEYELAAKLRDELGRLSAENVDEH